MLDALGGYQGMHGARQPKTERLMKVKFRSTHSAYAGCKQLHDL